MHGPMSVKRDFNISVLGMPCTADRPVRNTQPIKWENCSIHISTLISQRIIRRISTHKGWRSQNQIKPNQITHYTKLATFLHLNCRLFYAKSAVF